MLTLVIAVEVAFVGIGALIGHVAGLGALGGALIGGLGIALLLGVFWIVVGGFAMRRELRRGGRPPRSRR